MKVVVIGATGTIGRAVVQAIGNRHEVIPVSFSKSVIKVDIADKTSITRMFERTGRVDAVISTAGLAKGTNRSIILPTINYEFPDPKCDLDYVPNEARRKEHCRALSNSFGFVGQNACLCIGRYDARGDQPDSPLDSHAA